MLQDRPYVTAQVPAGRAIKQGCLLITLSISTCETIWRSSALPKDYLVGLTACGVGSWLVTCLCLSPLPKGCNGCWMQCMRTAAASASA